MQWWRKANWLAAGEVIDALRIFPRLLICAYGWWVYKITSIIIQDYFALAPADRTTQVTAFITVVLPGIFGLAAVVFQTYSNGGYDWVKYREFYASHPIQNVPVCGTSSTGS